MILNDQCSHLYNSHIMPKTLTPAEKAARGRVASALNASDPHHAAILKHLKRLHSWQVDHKAIAPILKRLGWNIPPNVDRQQLARWHYGPYYGYGERGLWIPLNSMGGMATRAFDTKTVKFPKRIENAIVKLLGKS